MVVHHPIAEEALDKFHQVFMTHRLHQIRISPEMISMIHRFDACVAREHDHHQMAKLGLRAQPGQQFKPVETGHIDIDDQDAWHRIGAAIRKLAPSDVGILDTLIAAANKALEAKKG